MIETESSLVSVIPQEWTVRSKIFSRGSYRQNWDNDFEENYKAVADALTASLAKEVFDKLSDRLSSPFLLLPRIEDPIKITFSLDITRAAMAERVKMKMGEKGSLSPFNEWLEMFLKDKDTEYRYSKLSGTREGDLDARYFQDRMAKIGKLVRDKILSLLECFSKTVANPLQYRVEWHRNAEKNSLFSSINSWDCAEDNTLSIKLWIDESFL